ncbi:MAG: serine/threonine protein kinase, partial [Oscillospiraceae bacterium]
MSAEKYKILRALNVSGTVTLAESTADGGKYVLKYLPEECVPIYRRISELPAQENLMQVHEILRQDDRTAAVCGFAEGTPLDELLDSGRVFPTDELCRIISQLCRAVEHLHHNGIIHRDINPKNIILDEKLHLTLIDYSISRLFAGNREQDTTLYGTEGFAPPEQYGFRETRFTADIYSVGVVLKLLLNGCPNCPPAQEVMLRKIAAKCTRFVPEKRFKSAAAVRRAVSRSRRIIPTEITAASAALIMGVITTVIVLHNFDREEPPISEVQLPQTTSAVTTASTTTQTTTTPAKTTASTTAQTTKTPAKTTATTTTQTTPTPAKTTATTTAQTTTTPAKTTATTTAQTTTTPAKTTASTTAQTT